MLHYVHEIVPNFVFLQRGAGEVCHRKQLPAVPENNPDESSDNEPKQ